MALICSKSPSIRWKASIFRYNTIEMPRTTYPFLSQSESCVTIRYELDGWMDGRIHPYRISPLITGSLLRTYCPHTHKFRPARNRYFHYRDCFFLLFLAQLSLPHNLFLGGIPDPDWLSPKVKVQGGFTGCIQKVNNHFCSTTCLLLKRKKCAQNFTRAT